MSASRLGRRLAGGAMGIGLVCLAASCGGRTDSPVAATKSQGGSTIREEGSAKARAFLLKKPAPADSGPKTPAGDLTTELSNLLNEVGIRYASMEHDYDEDLLATIDKAEAYLSGRLKGPAPRAMPKLTEQEEYDHLRETIRRWHAQSSTDLRVEIDRLQAKVAARKPGEARYYPDFHKEFATVFDSFIRIEVAEMRERRNRAIHQAAKPLLDKYRATAPDLVKQYEATLNAPPYNLPPESPTQPAAKTSPPPKA